MVRISQLYPTSGTSFVLVTFLLSQQNTMTKAIYKRKHLIWGFGVRSYKSKIIVGAWQQAGPGAVAVVVYM